MSLNYEVLRQEKFELFYICKDNLNINAVMNTEFQKTV